MAAAEGRQGVVPPWMRDGGPPPLRAAILRRRAARRANSSAPEIERGDCGPCGGWGVVNGVRCGRCKGSGHALGRKGAA